MWHHFRYSGCWKKPNSFPVQTEVGDDLRAASTSIWRICTAPSAKSQKHPLYPAPQTQAGRMRVGWLFWLKLESGWTCGFIIPVLVQANQPLSHSALGLFHPTFWHWQIQSNFKSEKSRAYWKHLLPLTVYLEDECFWSTGTEPWAQPMCFRNLQGRWLNGPCPSQAIYLGYNKMLLDIYSR